MAQDEGEEQRHRRDKCSQPSRRRIHQFRESLISQLLCFLLGQIANHQWSLSIPFCLEIGQSTFQMPLQQVLVQVQ